MRPLPLALSADPPVSAPALLALLAGLARHQPAVAGELLLDRDGLGSPLDRLRRLHTARRRRQLLREDRGSAQAARRWARARRRNGPSRKRPTSSLAFSWGLLEVAEEWVDEGRRDEAFELVLEAEEVALRASASGEAERADRRDIETRAYVLCGRLFRETGRIADLLEVVRGLEAEAMPVARSLRTEARVLALRSAVAEDAGQLPRALDLAFDAFDRLTPPFRLIDRAVLHSLSDLLVRNGSAREAAVLLFALRRQGQELLPAEARAELALRAADAWLAGDRPGPARRALERARADLARSRNPVLWLVLRAGWAEYFARTGRFDEAEAAWGLVHAESKRGSRLALRAILASLEIAVVQQHAGSVQGWLATLREELGEIDRSSVDFSSLAALATELEREPPTPERLADARAYLRSLEKNPGLEFRRPWPGVGRPLASLT